MNKSRQDPVVGTTLLMAALPICPPIQTSERALFLDCSNDRFDRLLPATLTFKVGSLFSGFFGQGKEQDKNMDIGKLLGKLVFGVAARV